MSRVEKVVNPPRELLEQAASCSEWSRDFALKELGKLVLEAEADTDEAYDLLAATSLEAGERIAALEKENETLRAQLAEQDDPCQWSDAQILEFLGVALRNVDVLGTVRLKEVRQGFQYMRNPNRKPTEPGAGDDH
jgi:uncharacterized small protein (DUF1192 family)